MAETVVRSMLVLLSSFWNPVLSSERPDTSRIFLGASTIAAATMLLFSSRVSPSASMVTVLSSIFLSPA